MDQTPEELGRKIREAQEKQARQEGKNLADGSLQAKEGGASALRVATDLVAALFVGGLLGYGIDHWLGTKPWGMVVFLFVGFGAGFMNLYKSQTGVGNKIGFKKD
jgi:ATP synthase protein I